MPDPKVVVAEKSRRRPNQLAPAPETAWKWVGWLALALAVAGVGDWLLAWYPVRFGTPEWEFATVVQTFSGLPLVTMGFAGLLGAGIALGKRWLIVTILWALVVWMLHLFAALGIFLLDVPMALRAAPEGLASTGVKKAIAKTVLLGLTFGTAYLAAAVGTYRHLRGR